MRPKTQGTALEREEILIISSDCIRAMSERIRSPRWHPSTHDTARLSWSRALTAMLTAYNGALRDRDLEDIRKRLNILEDRLGEV